MKKVSLNGLWNLSGNGYACAGTVPGSVYSFLLENKLMEDPYYRRNELAALEIAEHEYIFSRSFAFDKPGESALLCCDGLDTLCDILLNGRFVGHAENMHRSYAFDITEFLQKENELQLTFHSANRYFKQKDAENHVPGNRETLIGYSHLRKSYCMSGWDWGPRLPDAGIWRDIYLLVGDTDRIREIRITQRHEGGRVFVTPCVSTVENRAEIKTFLTSPDGKKIEITPNAEYDIR